MSDEEDEGRTLASCSEGDVVAIEWERHDYELCYVAGFEWTHKRNRKLARKVTAFIRPFDSERWTRRQHRCDPIIMIDAGTKLLAFVEDLQSFIRPAVRRAEDFGYTRETDPLLAAAQETDDGSLDF